MKSVCRHCLQRTGGSRVTILLSSQDAHDLEEPSKWCQVKVPAARRLCQNRWHGPATGCSCSRSEGSATSGGTRRRSSKLYPSACRAYPCEREKARERWQLGTSSSNVDLTL
jgi:hypothetical protein